MTEVLQLITVPAPRRRGRPRNPEVDLAGAEKLTLPQVLAYARAKGRPMGRARLMTAILTRQLPALQDLFRTDRYGEHLLLVRRSDLDAWLDTTFQPFIPAPMPGDALTKKGLLPQAL